MNVHAIAPKTYHLWAAYSYEPDHGDEASFFAFFTESEKNAFIDGIGFAGDDASWWEGTADPTLGTYYYCVYCSDWMWTLNTDDFDENHPDDEH